jgi:hypothetical protein
MLKLELAKRAIWSNRVVYQQGWNHHFNKPDGNIGKRGHDAHPISVNDTDIVEMLSNVKFNRIEFVKIME